MAAFTPRTSSNGMAGAQYWYSTTNPFYPTYGLPNCTCYVFGRWWEILGAPYNSLPRGDAGTWWSNAPAALQKGSTPKLGAIICMSGGPYSGRGHVAVVEKIYSDGSILCSNSGYTRDPNQYAQLYFYLRSGNASNNWGYPEYTLQGFIYCPEDFDPDIDPDEPPTPDPTPEPGAYPSKLLIYKKQIYRNQGRLIGHDVYN